MRKIKKQFFWLIFSLALILIIDHFWLSGLVAGQTLTPEVTLTWSTDSYVPPTYLGKPLPARGSLIEVAAHLDPPADGQELNPKELIYNWFLDDHFQKATSGEGKQVFKLDTESGFKGRYLVKVEIKNKEGTPLATSSYLLIELQEPQLVLRSASYLARLETSSPISPQYQISANQEMNFIVQPYFFNIKNVDELTYHWSLSGQETSQFSGKKPNIFLLKVGQLSQSLKRDIQVWAENKNNPLQRAQTKIEVILTP